MIPRPLPKTEVASNFEFTDLPRDTDWELVRKVVRLCAGYSKSWEEFYSSRTPAEIIHENSRCPMDEIGRALIENTGAELGAAIVGSSILDDWQLFTERYEESNP